MRDSIQLEPLPQWTTRALRVGLVILLVAMLVCAYLTAGFVAEFHVLRPTVYSNTLQPLGPKPRAGGCIKSVEKTLVWECDDRSVFERHRLGCRVWLWLAGIPAGVLRAL